ncbi:MAG: hypothetical protein AAF805_05685 [Planctomycetota bacterium]
MANQPNEPDESTERGPLARVLGPIVARRGVLTALAVIAAAGFLSRGVWQAAERQIAEDARYTLTAATVTATPPPAWVGGEVIAEALEAAGVGSGLPAIGPAGEVAAKLSAAIAAHPWVASVERVELAPPNRATVSLRYRTPRVAAATADGLTPLDGEGVVLPAAGLATAGIANLPRIETRSLGGRPPRAGDRWEDPRVLGGVRLIGKLGDAWAELSLLEAIPSASPTVRGAARRYAYRLRSTGQTLIEWGCASGDPPPGEASFEQKLAWLRQYVAQEGPLDSVATSPKGIDVRHGLLVERRVVKNDPPDAASDEVLR